MGLIFELIVIQLIFEFHFFWEKLKENILNKEEK